MTMFALTMGSVLFVTSVRPCEAVKVAWCEMWAVALPMVLCVVIWFL